MTLNQQARHVRTLKLRAARLKRQADEAAVAFKQAEHELYERMIDEDCQHTNTGGVTFVRQATEYGVVQDEPAFRAWAATHAPELFEEKPIKARINELVRDHLRDGTPLPPGLNFYVREYVAQRGTGEAAE